MTAALRAARLREIVLRAGERHLAFAARRAELSVERKGRVDLVTEADRAVQEELVGALREAFPGERIVAEEGELAEDARSGGAVWYVDPIDGTTNFVHGHLFSCISVARWVDGQPDLGVVFAPELDELFRARRGDGAWLERPARGGESQRLRASACAELREALMATGYPYERGPLTRFNLTVTAHFLASARGVRRAGSAALDLCWVAAARLDGFWEFALSPWDVAAGILVAREAGAVVSDFEGGGDPLHGRRLLAAAPGIHEQVLRKLADAHQNPRLDCLAPPLEAPVARRGPLPGDPR